MATELSCVKGYCMSLANGQGWHILANRGMEKWIDKLATIMELKRGDGNGYAKLIFTREERGHKEWREPISCLDPKVQENLPRSGWKARKFPSIQIWSHPRVPDVICEIGHEETHELEILRMSLAGYAIIERAQSRAGLPLHAALIEREGDGVLLAAPAGTGKSTCCRRLPSPWQPLSDDETLIILDDQERYLAHPFPTWSYYLWRCSEQTWNIQRHVFLKAIFILEQAEFNQVFPVGRGQAAVFLVQSAMEVYHTNWRNLDTHDLRTLRRRLFNNACELARSIPVFKLLVSLNGRFWEEIEKVLF